jgi:hypothetical protein
LSMMGESREFSVLFFPHCVVVERDLERLFPFLGPLSVCLPWFMEPTPPQGGENVAPIEVLRPPPSLKPKGDFNRRLSEYRNWIKQNQDKGYVGFLKISQNALTTEPAKWEIRRLIREKGGLSPAPAVDDPFKWHLILHLAAEVELNRQEARDLLVRLKESRSPLEAALGEENPVHGLFEDLSPLSGGEDFFAGEGHLRKILEAWTALFGKHLSKEGLLVTLDPQVMRYVIERFDGMLEREEVVTGRPKIQLSLPDLASLPQDDAANLRERFRKGGTVENVRLLIRSLLRGETEEVKKRLDKLEEAFSAEFVPSHLILTIQHLPALSGKQDSHGEAFITALSGQALALVEDWRFRESSK